MAKILDKNSKSILVKLTIKEYKILDKINFFYSPEEEKNLQWENIVDFWDWVGASEILAYLKSEHK